MSVGRASLQVSGPIWEGVCRYPGTCAGGFGGDGEFMTLTLPGVRVLAVSWDRCRSSAGAVAGQVPMGGASLAAGAFFFANCFLGESSSALPAVAKAVIFVTSHLLGCMQTPACPRGCGSGPGAGSWGVGERDLGSPSPACTAAQPPAEPSHAYGRGKSFLSPLPSFCVGTRDCWHTGICLPQLQGATSALRFFGFLSFCFLSSGKSCQHLTGFLGV